MLELTLWNWGTETDKILNMIMVTQNRCLGILVFKNQMIMNHQIDYLGVKFVKKPDDGKI